ncbi:hypothetical protein [Mesorhizobium sp. 131-2-5]|uniref:hypothetical protein n=1 Tax=Mesorhizobium sp. 131-2-5 TaxID=2744519 RepID=UPI001926BBC3|nr:hypothetical protein [Mesorhizobium sp. 131-2-5]
MKFDDKPQLIYRLDQLLGWLESYMLHRGPRVTVTERSVSFFQALMRCGRAMGHIPSSGRVEMIDTVLDGFMGPSKTAKCNAGLNTVLFHILNELLLEDEPHMELHEFCSHLIEALGLAIFKSKRGKNYWFTSSADFTKVEGVTIEVMMPAQMREAVDAQY